MKKRYRILLLLVFVVSILVDAINGYLQVVKGVHLNIGFLLRGVIILMCFPSFMKQKTFKRVWKPFFLVYIIVLCIWLIRNPFSVVGEISALSKYIYIYFLYAFFFENWDYVPYRELLKYILNYSLIIASILVVCYIFKIGNATYGGGEFGWGTKGFFKAGNDLGLTMIFGLTMACLYFIKYNSSLIVLFKVLWIGVGSILIGSRTCFFMVPFILLLFSLYLIFSKKQKSVVLRTSVILIYAFFVPFFVSRIIAELDDYALQKLTIESIESSRDIYKEPARKYIQSFDLVSTFVGNGYEVYLDRLGQSVGNEKKLAEADLYDVVGPYGYVFGSLFFLFYIYSTFTAIRRFLRNKNIDYFVYATILFAFCGISILSGHALANVMVAPIYAIIAVRVFKDCDCGETNKYYSPNNTVCTK